MVQAGEHIKRDFGKLGQCPEKNVMYGKDLESMSSQETWWKEGMGYIHDRGLQIFMEKGLGLSHAA